MFYPTFPSIPSVQRGVTNRDRIVPTSRCYSQNPRCSISLVFVEVSGSCISSSSLSASDSFAAWDKLQLLRGGTTDGVYVLVSRRNSQAPEATVYVFHIVESNTVAQFVFLSFVFPKQQVKQYSCVGESWQLTKRFRRHPPVQSSIGSEASTNLSPRAGGDHDKTR